MKMVTDNFYSSMIGKHFNQLEVKLLCALIDQRIQFRLPSYMLRKRLVELIHAINENMVAKVQKQKEAEAKILRDLQAYPLNQDECFNFSVVLNSGVFCKVDLQRDEISYTSAEGITETTVISYVTQWQGNHYIRYIKGMEATEGMNKLYSLTTYEAPVISINSVTDAHNQAILELLLTVTDQEKGILEEKTCPNCCYKRVSPMPGSFVLASGDSIEPAPRRKYQRRSTFIPTRPLQKMVQYQCEKCQTVFYL
ncbi:hypothetical protein MKZ21_30715 [Paenibacillus sp. FSL P2-0536]|uniref:hypothetical protein n=1 Tax=Paenibacillus sp. FSL P2-0536 TaxID=2921629 RepID=UPI0030FBAAED